MIAGLNRTTAPIQRNAPYIEGRSHVTQKHSMELPFPVLLIFTVALTGALV